eukprot:TRINITY_DN6952_c0_g1_i3.p1 TRINITY_DN6952_c0_g1~~TRINITY_DN6952_c0_g1_i3.p1  ORF type:complete len:293 (-),score=72.32 TRINITY_DN6952_c0_g1_i3:148-1026(-)
MNWLERQLDEIQTIRAVFCCPNEFETNEPQLQLAMARAAVGDRIAMDELWCRVTPMGSGLCCTLQFPPTYPEISPKVELSHPTLSKPQVARIRCALSETAEAETGGRLAKGEEPTECGLLVLEMGREMASDLMQKPEVDAEVDAEVDPEGLRVTVIQIDHMNDGAAYMKKVLGWVGQMGISGKLLYRLSKKGGKRCQDIFMICESCPHDLRHLLTNLRTHKLSVRDVREKKSRVIWESPQEYQLVDRRFVNFQTVEYDGTGDISRLWREWLGDESVGGLTLEQLLLLSLIHI